MFIFTIFALSVLTVMELESFTPGIVEMQKSFELSTFEAQLSISLNFISYCICSIWCGLLADKYNKKLILCIGLFLFTIGSIMCSFALNYYVLLIGRILQGAGCASPAVLSYVFLSDKYSMEKQTVIIGYLHGAIAVTSSLSPVIGSYLTLYCGWRSNFILLFVLGFVCLVFSLFFIKDTTTTDYKGENATIRTYINLLTSKSTAPFIIAICCFIAPYIVFIGISPILYIGDLGVSQKHFGYHPLMLAAGFGLSSFFSGILLKKFGQKQCVYAGLFLLSIHAVLILSLSIFGVSNPYFITACEFIGSISVVFPINILFPFSMEASKQNKGMMSALMVAGRLSISSLGLWLIGVLYDNTFFYIGVWIFITILIAIVSSLYILKHNKEIKFET